ncbi:MAG: phage tail protein [Alistipes senegalensis]|nr:phage tail protein [Oxalobacter formigenes]MCM1280881.1 phage tail protein [Alistipes senegalensis]
MAEAVVTNIYRRHLAAHMAGSGSISPIAYMAFGDGGHNEDLTPKEPSTDAISLNHEILRKPLESVVQEDLYSVTGKGTLEIDEVAGAAISEAGLFDADGNLVGLKTFSPKFKESDERYEISIKLLF